MHVDVKGVYVKYHYHPVHVWLTDCNLLHVMLETNVENKLFYAFDYYSFEVYLID